MQRVVVTGMGVICPLGLTTDELWTNLASGKSGVGLIQKFDATEFPVKVSAEVKDFDPAKYMDIKTMERTQRTIHMALPAAKEAIEASGLDMSKEKPERVGIVSACMQENMTIVEGWKVLQRRGPRRADPLFFTKGAPSIISLQVGLLYGFNGPCISVNSLCASGADVIANAVNYIRLGYADVMAAVASDTSLDEMTVASMGVLGALSKNPDPETACRPFDLNRDGFIYGEGAGALVLESYEHAKQRGAPILAEVAGTGWSYDAFDVSAPQAKTETIAMKNALRNAGVRPDEVDYINAHGTSTKLNDVCETKAIKLTFGDQAYKIPVSSSKSMFGHLITAGGLVESIAVVLAINHGLIPPTIHYETPDPECDLDYVPNVAREAKLDICLKDSFGFGGQNCCLILKRFKD